jgi:superfamily II DNA or RNA helicase
MSNFKFNAFDVKYGKQNTLKNTNCKSGKIHLRDWQKQCKTEFLDNFINGEKNGGIINATTGAGKTITILSLIQAISTNTDSKILIAVPQRDISFGFCKDYNIEDTAIKISHNLCDTKNNKNELGKIEKFIFENQDKQLKLLLATATLFRGDHDSVVSNINNYHVFKLPLDHHFEFNCNYLKKIKYDFTITNKKWETSIKHQIVKGDKTILFVPHTSSKYISNDKMHYVNTIIKDLSDDKKVVNNGDYFTISRNGKPFNIVDLVDDTNDKKRKEKEIYIHNNPDEIDIIIAMCKFKEGSDWPLANNIIIVGIRNSLTDIVQMCGRGFRDHISKRNGLTKIIQIIPDIIQSNVKEDVGEKINEFFQCLFSSFIFEEILHPSKLKLEKEPRLNKVKSTSDNKFNYSELFDTEEETWLSRYI